MNLPRIKSGFKLLLRSSTMFFTSFPNWNLMGIRARHGVVVMGVSFTPRIPFHNSYGRF